MSAHPGLTNTTSPLGNELMQEQKITEQLKEKLKRRDITWFVGGVSTEQVVDEKQSFGSF